MKTLKNKKFESITNNYNQSYFEEISGYSQHGGYSKMRKETIKWYNGIFNFLGKKSDICLEQGDKKKILDIGCAYGYIISELNKRNFETYGLDISHYAIKIAKEQNKTSKIKVGDIHNRLPFKNKFDLILCLEALEHLQNPKIALKNVYSSLKKGGSLIVTTPNPNSRSILYSPYKDPTHISLNNTKEWAEIMKKVQFRKISYWTIHAIPFSKYFTGKVEHVSCPDSIGGTILMVCKK